MAGNITLRQYQIGGVYSGGNAITPPEYLFADGFYLPAIHALEIAYPLSDSITPVISHHRCAYPGVAYECPIRTIGGAGFDFAVIESAPAGMTVGIGLSENGYGDLWPDENALNLKWPNPVEGTYPIVIRVYKQLQSIVVRFTLVCSTENHWFVSPTAMGTGDGLSPQNAASWENTYLGDSTNSPAKGKILYCRGGTYAGSASGYQLNPNFNPINIVGFPGETARFTDWTFINSVTDDVYMGNLTIADLYLTSEGRKAAIFLGGLRHRHTSFKITFDNLTDNSMPYNQSCHFTDGIVGNRQNIVVTQCKTINCTVPLVEFYSVDRPLVERNQFIINNGITSLSRSSIFYKADYAGGQICYNEFNNPDVTVGQFIYLFGSNYRSTPESLTQADYNTVNSAGGVAFHLNSDGYEMKSVNYIRRNSIRGARIFPHASGLIGSYSYIDKNATENIDGNTRGVATSGYPPIGNYTVTGEIASTSGVFDSNMRLTDASKIGTVGAQIRRGS